VRDAYALARRDIGKHCIAIVQEIAGRLASGNRHGDRAAVARRVRSLSSSTTSRRALLGGYADVLVPSMRARESMRAWASRYARLVYERTGNNKRQTCRELGISYHTLRSHLQFRPERPDAPQVKGGQPVDTPDSDES
jgi:transcriptional regulator with AAA-type ATPase domain